MTSKEVQNTLNRFLSGLLGPLGFTQIEDQRYGRPENDAIAQLSFPWRMSPSGEGMFTAWVALSFESVAQWLNDKDGPIVAPITVMPIHLLHDDKRLLEWTFSTARELEELRVAVLHELREYALPFIDRNSRLSQLRRALESSNDSDWIDIGFDADTRITTLAAIYMADGDKAGAIRTVDEGLKALAESLAHKPQEAQKREFLRRSIGMKILRGRLVASG